MGNFSCQPADYTGQDPSWCPGCGNFNILKALQNALAELQIPPHQALLCSGIGQAAKMPHYLRANGFNGLHGRALPPAVGARVANKNLKVIVTSGDGDTYGEGGNHFIHTIRRNPDLAHFVHNNQVYGLTKGQASPTSEQGMKTKVQPAGVILPPFNPLSIALAMGAGFVARCFSGEVDHLKEVMKEAISFPGYALVDILQNCVTFNKLNTFAWYKNRVVQLKDHDPADHHEAARLARRWGDEIPIGILYREKNPRATFESQIRALEGEPLVYRPFDPGALQSLQDEFI